MPATPSVTYTYGTSASSHNRGRLVTVTTSGNVSESYTYNDLGRITQVVKTIDSTNYTIGYGYNLAGEITSITYPSGREVEQSYDAIGRLTSIASGTTTYLNNLGYNVAGQVTGFSYGNGVAASFGYTAERLQLSTLSYVKDSTTLLSLSYGYSHPGGGNNGQITGITDSTGTGEAGRSVDYTYDALHRLKTAVTQGSTAYPQWGLSWTYDRYGNRTQQSVTHGSGPSNSVSVSATTNRITESPYAYDANGNMTNDGRNTLTYDAESRVRTSVYQSQTATYTYDAGALRVKKVAGSTTTRYIFAGAKVIAEYENGASPSSPTREYIFAGGQLVATHEGSALRYHHADHLSVRVTTDTSGAKIGEQGHFPFGENWYSSSTTTKFGFTSYERDGESLNDYAVFRTHINRLGRFNRPDPIAGSIADPQSLNRYAYVANDPINFVDRLGLFPCFTSTTTIEVPYQLPIVLYHTLCISFLGGGVGPGMLLNTGNEDGTPGDPEQQQQQPTVDPKVLGECTRELFGVELRFFLPSTPGRNGMFVGKGKDTVIGRGKSQVFGVTNDVRSKSAPSLTRETPPKQRPIFGLVWGRTPADLPYINYTANDAMDPKFILELQIHELGHSLAIITGLEKERTPRGARHAWGGDELENCVKERGGFIGT